MANERFCTSLGQLRTFTRTTGAIRPDDGTWSDTGDPVSCCLYLPKGSEIPAPLALMDRTIYMLAWTLQDWPVTPQSRVVVDGVEYEVHDVPSERSNRFLPVAMVSRLK
jgi:hypothetical protein